MYFSEDPDEMPHYEAFHQSTLLLLDKNTQKYIIFLEIITCDPSIYNGPSQVYCIKPEGRIHLCIKG